ncbi:protein tumorous imaginal discs, mitochondrial-like isoform X2 [Haliotis rufescens]|uniref:protein tumorous imaginal discs, mitochondrial-like isoform X2 n=1 Tax=Haliotis rufescens TaxID=6454 RepID=UPI00201E8830|nr:protein tumorous imaginal discs, mitochondrial-like isoform X2 [Haliotis rufescens]
MAALRRTCAELTRRSVNTQSSSVRSCLQLEHISPTPLPVRSLSCASSFRSTNVTIGFGQTVRNCPQVTSVHFVHTSNTKHKRDYYDVLGVDRSADAATIKKAYYQLAKKFHPDVSKNDPSAAGKFQEVSEAYEVLGDTSKRQQYDTFGMAGSEGNAGQRQSGFSSQGFENFHGSIDPEELFRNIFGNAGFRMSGFGNMNDFEESKFGFAPASEIMMDLTFQEAARGVNKDINVNVKDVCPKCSGKKAEPGTKPVKCHFCNGTGMETINTGPFMMRTTCRHCFGSRVLIKTPCTECNGKGSLIMRKRVTVPVPAGVENGQTVRMPVGRQEIFITFKVAKSRVFRRDAADVHSDVTVSLSQAILGGTLRIPGIYDDILLTIPNGTQSHERIRLPGKGISRVNSYGYGDHYVHIKIKIPTRLSAEQKALILAYAELEKGVEGTVDGVARTQSAGKKDGGKSDSEKHEEEKDEGGFLGKIKKTLFG